MEVNIIGLVAVIVFYILILVVGIIAGRKSKSTEENADSEDVMVAGRNIGLLVGVFTMTATWVGGGYINGTAEQVGTAGYGLVTVQAPFGYCLSLILGGLLFAKKMRDSGYVTMLDPFQKQFGERMGGLLFIPALCGEIFWSAAILAALGSTLSVIIGLKMTISVIISAVIAVGYTLFGGLYSVAYTDVVQLICIFVGLVVATPFILTNEHVTPIAETAQGGWFGKLEATPALAAYIDSGLMLTFGGIPWQVYFQRVLSCKTSQGAQILSFVAAFGCFVMAIPPVLIGAASYGCDWKTVLNGTRFINGTFEPAMTLPMTLQFLTPKAVSFIGLGAISAAVMSSADSSILSASSMFARNIYKLTIRPKASEREIIWIMRGCVFLFGALSCVMGILIESIYGLWFLCSDLVYCILFPQLLCVVYMPFVNTYGSLAGFLAGLILRLLGGEQILKLPAVIRYPYYDASTNTQNFPYKTFTMLIALLVEICVSVLMNWLFKSGKIAAHHDRFNACINERVENEYLSSVGGSRLTVNEQPSNIDEATLQEISKINNAEPVEPEQIDMVEYNDKYETEATVAETHSLVSSKADDVPVEPTSETVTDK